MIKDKRFKKFYEVGCNRYYVLPYDNELYLATENFLELPKKFFRKREISQGTKLLELTPPMLVLFNSMVDTKMVEVDEEFKDMCAYEKIDNSKLRKEIKAYYDTALQIEIDTIIEDFNRWCAEFAENSADKYSEEEIENTLKANEIRVSKIIDEYKKMNISNNISTSIPNKKSENDVVKKMITNGFEFLYSHQLTSTMKCYYLYDLDKFGTITIYKVVCVKEHIKAINSFVYDREIAQELLAFIENNKL